MTSGSDNTPVGTPETDLEQKQKEAYFTASQSQLIWSRFKRNKAAMAAATVLVFMTLQPSG